MLKLENESTHRTEQFRVNFIVYELSFNSAVAFLNLSSAASKTVRWIGRQSDRLIDDR